MTMSVTFLRHLSIALEIVDCFTTILIKLFVGFTISGHKTITPRIIPHNDELLPATDTQVEARKIRSIFDFIVSQTTNASKQHDRRIQYFHHTIYLLFYSESAIMSDDKDIPKKATEGTVPLGYSDDDVSFNDEDDIVDLSGHQSVVSDDDSKNSPSSRRSSTQGDSATNNMTRNNNDGGELIIAKRENQAVMIWKMVFIAVLVLITVGISVAIFVYVDGQEQSDFEVYFEEDSYKIFSELGVSIYQRFAELDSMTVALASAYVNVTSSTSALLPSGPLKDFAVIAAKTRSLSQAVAYQHYHFVPNDEDIRASWEDYAREHGSDWILQSLQVLVDDESYQGKKPSLLSGARQTFNTTEDKAKKGIQFGSKVLPPNSGP
jgi:uncharacterized membrane-anchored protein YhcB (DUF1043 family)